MMKSRTRILPRLAAFSLMAAVAGTGVASAATDFLQRFDGKWSGSGLVQRNEGENPTQVNCTVRGNTGANGIAIGGTCRAYVLFTREIGAELTYDPKTERYTGVYRGSKIGPARLSGKRQGDALNLTVTWPKEVYGDRKANMTIRNTGGGTFSFVVTDEVNGQRVTTTNLTLRKG
jgi:hypothetical protein